MKKTGNILIIIGMIFTIISFAGLLIAGIVLTVYSSPDNKAEIMKGLLDGSITSSYDGTVSEQADAILTLFKVLGIVFFILSAGYCIAIFVDSLSLKRSSTGSYIAVIIVNVIFFNILGLIGGILGLVDDKQ